MSRLAAFKTLAARRAASAWTRGPGYLDRSVAAGAALAAAWIGWAAWHPLEIRAVVEAFVILEIVFAAGVVQLSHAVATAGERERVSFDLLLLAPMSGFEQLLARASGRMLGVAAVLGAATPPLLLLVPAGGVGAGEIVSAQLIILAVAAVSVGLASFLSALFVRPAVAVAVGWAAIAAWLAGPRLGRLLAPAHAGLWDAIERLSIAPVLRREWAGVGAEFAATAAALGWSAAALVALCAAGGAFLRGRHVAAAGRGSPSASKLRKALRSAGASPRWARGFRPLFSPRHPLVRQASLIERDSAFRLAWLAFALFLAVAAASVPFTEAGRSLDAQRGIAGGYLLLVLLLTATRGALGLAIDRRRGRLETLISANVEPDDMLRARLAGLLQRSAYLALPAAVYGVVVELAFDPSLAGLLRAGLLVVGAALALVTAAVLSVETAIRFRWMIQGFVGAVAFAVPVAAAVGALAASGPLRAAFLVPLWISVLLALHAMSVRRLRAWILD